MFPTARAIFQHAAHAWETFAQKGNGRYPLFQVACFIYFDYDDIS